MDKILELLINNMLLNNVILIVFLTLFIITFWRENNRADSPVHWTDLIMEKNKLSLSRFGQLLGYILSSWVIIYLAQVPAFYPYYPFVFLSWLAYCAGSYAFNKFIDKKKLPGEQ